MVRCAWRWKSHGKPQARALCRRSAFRPAIAGKRVEFSNVIDWNTRESNLKATFPLTASNHMATYNWDIGTIERPTAEPKKFEVPSHQWIDLTDMSGEFGATILTDCKNGSDKPNDNTIRLTLIRTPGTAGGYSRSGHAGYWASRICLRHRRTCGRLARRADRLAGAAVERSADRVRYFEAFRNAGTNSFVAQGQQSADPGSGAEESGAQRRSHRAHGGTRRQTAT